MTYLLIEDGRVVSAHDTLPSARAAGPQGAGPSEAGPMLGGEPAWWFRTWPDKDEAEIGIVRPQATALGIRFELRMCQAPAGTCNHPGCSRYVTAAVSSSYELLNSLAAFLPSSWVWAGLRSPDPRGDTAEFHSEAEALTERLASELRPALRAVEEPPRDVRTLSARREAAYGLVVQLLSRHFGPPGPDTAEEVSILPVVAGTDLHLVLTPPAAEGAALCGSPVQPSAAEAIVDVSGLNQCDKCFGRAPITPTPVLTAAEHDAWMDYLRAPFPHTP
jgi:hypothetical protein